MAATNAHSFQVTDKLEVYSIQKQPADKVTVAFNFAAGALASGVTVSSVSAATITPAGVDAPTASAPAVDGTSHAASTVIDAGTTAWNTNGKGRISFTATYSNGDKREIDLDVTIVQL